MAPENLPPSSVQHGNLLRIASLISDSSLHGTLPLSFDCALWLDPIDKVHLVSMVIFFINSKTMSIKYIFAIATLTLSIIPIQAREKRAYPSNNNSPQRTHQTKNVSGDAGFSIGQMNLDSTAAEREGVDTTALVFDFFADAIISRKYILGAGFGYIKMDDKRPFSATVQGIGLANNGDISTKSSTVDGFSYYAQAGYQKRFSIITLRGLIGVCGMNLSRSLSNVQDSPKENVDFDAGFFVKPSVMLSFSPKHSMFLSYTNYTSSSDLLGDYSLGYCYNF